MPEEKTLMCKSDQSDDERNDHPHPHPHHDDHPFNDHPFEELEPRMMMTVFTVTNANDSGAGSLRDALQHSNDHVGVDTIDFNIGSSSSKVIRPSSPLPE